MLGQIEVRRDFVELHRLDAGGLVFAGRDHAVLDGIVDFVIGDDGRAHADGRERLRPDRRALHPHLEALEIGQILERLVGEDVADAAAGIADQHHLGLRRDLVGDRRQDVGFDDLVHVLDALEHERSIDERRRLGEGRHVGRRDDAVIDRLALRHVFEILLLETERRVLVQREIDRLAVIFLHQLFEPEQRLVEGVIVVELHGAVQRDRRLCPEDRRHSKNAGGCCRTESGEYGSALHGFPSPVPRPCSGSWALPTLRLHVSKRMQKRAAMEANFQCTGMAELPRRAHHDAAHTSRRSHRSRSEIGLKSLADAGRLSYDLGNHCVTMIAIIGRRSGTCVAKTLTADASRPSGGGNHAAADHFRGRHRRQQLRAGPQGRLRSACLKPCAASASCSTPKCSA